MSSGYHSVVYGPVPSRRFGKSLGINPIPSPKDGCPKDCVYCETGTPDGEPVAGRVGKAPSAGVVVTSAARRIIELSKGGEKIASILVAGNNEPTMHPGLQEITENLRTLRDKWFPKADLCLLSETPDVETPDLAHSLSLYDKAAVRFEWGSGRLFTSMTKRTAEEYKALIELLTAAERFVVQAVFITTNSTQKEITSWIRKLEEIRPAEVQVLTVPASSKSPKPLAASKLEKIAATVTEKTGIPATAFASEKQTA
jgi:wyosine [tRNA(Phe)-imidazoG37] synthetase (radical SAM superfamily)